MLPHTWWLLAGVAGMYVYDAVLLLYHNEVVFFEKRDGSWSFSAGSDFQLAGRHVYIPSLLAPQRRMLRLRWSSRSSPVVDPSIRGLRPWSVGVSATSMSVLLVFLVFALLPVVLATDVLVLLAWMIALYVSIAFALWRVWRLRKVTGLQGKELAGIASDALLCAPYALNLVRKQGLRVAGRFDVFSTAHALLDAPERIRLAAMLRGKLQRQMDLEAVDSARHAELIVYLQQVEGALA